MSRTLMLTLLLALCAGPLNAQTSGAERPPAARTSVTAFAAYVLEYERVLRPTGISRDPGSRTFGVPAGPAAGFGLRTSLASWVGLDTGVLYRPAQRSVPICERAAGAEAGTDCGGEGDVGYLFALRFGGYLALPTPLPLSVSVAPMLVRQGLLTASKPEWEAGLVVGAAVGVPLGGPGLAGQLAVERHYVRGSQLVSNDPRFTEEAPWQPILLRLGLTVTPGAAAADPRRR